MAIEIKVPDIGTTVEEVTLKRWLKNEGEFAFGHAGSGAVDFDRTATERA